MSWNNMFKALVVWLVPSWGFWSFVTWDPFPFLTIGDRDPGYRVMFLYVELIFLVVSALAAFATVREAE